MRKGEVVLSVDTWNNLLPVVQSCAEVAVNFDYTEYTG